MQFTALIEYFVSGILASAWFFGFCYWAFDLTNQWEADKLIAREILVAFHLAAAYVLGIFVDTASSYCIRVIMKEYKRARKLESFGAKWIYCVGKFLLRKCGRPKSIPYEKNVKILSLSTEDLIRTMEVYTSRDRIARTTCLNALLGGIVALIVLPMSLGLKLAIMCFIIVIVSWLMWLRLRRLTSTFKKLAIARLGL